VGILRQIASKSVIAWLIVAGGSATVLADPPVVNPTEPPKTLNQDSFLSSLKQAIGKGSDNDVVRGHFELGTAPNLHRYFCLVDSKTGKREPNGVLGDLVPLANGMNGLKNESVSFYSCANAEQQGLLVTAGYVLVGPAAAAAAPSVPTPAPLPVEAAKPAAVEPNRVTLSLTQIDVAGVKLGMTPDEVRAILKSKKLLEYTESAETLSYLDPTTGVMHALPDGRFVNVIAAWTPPPPGSASDAFAVSGESYEVMFTPVPGKERAMGIVHSVGSTPANAIHELALENGLLKKFGGYGESAELPEAPTWRVQGSGNVITGDPCNRRGTFGGLGSLTVAGGSRGNIALKKTTEEFNYQIAHCGVAIITEDHFTANGGALSADRLVTRFTVTAYSPAFALEGAETAARLIHSAGGAAKQSDASRAKDPAASSL
jgi:hypothetical protein